MRRLGYDSWLDLFLSEYYWCATLREYLANRESMRTNKRKLMGAHTVYVEFPSLSLQLDSYADWVATLYDPTEEIGVHLYPKHRRMLRQGELRTGMRLHQPVIFYDFRDRSTHLVLFNLPPSNDQKREK